MGGFTASVMTAPSENQATTGRFVGGMAMYKGSMFSVGVGYNERRNERAQKSLTSTIVGANVKLGPGSFSALYGTYKDNAPSGLSTIAASVTPAVGAATAAVVQNAFIEGFKQDAVLMHIGYKLEMGVNTVYFAYSVADDKRAANADTKSYGITYSYALSKRTDLNVAAVRFVNTGLGQAAPGGTGYLGGVTGVAGQDSTSLALGIRHKF
jgi:hypothetical protein